jgi:RNA polymerase sigma-70 factor (ECF subfamily)
VTQDFFATFLRREGFQRAQPEQGKLRAYLKSAIRHHLYHWRRDGAALRRGGGQEPVALDADDAPDLPAPELADYQYDVQWALVVMERAMSGLKDGYSKRGRLDIYERLKPTLLIAEYGDASALAEELGMTRGALAVEQHRARRRLAELLRAQVADTLDEAAEVDAELLHLLHVLANHTPD